MQRQCCYHPIFKKHGVDTVLENDITVVRIQRLGAKVVRWAITATAKSVSCFNCNHIWHKYSGHTAVAVMWRIDEPVAVSRCRLHHIIGQSVQNWPCSVSTMAATNTVTHTHTYMNSLTISCNNCSHTILVSHKNHNYLPVTIRFLCIMLLLHVHPVR